MSNALKAKIYSVNGGALLECHNLDLEGKKTELLSILAEFGFVILRGLKTDVSYFTHLVKSVSSRLSLDPARSFHSEAAQKVDAGFDAVGFHCENGNSPFWPDLAWFYCEKAASVGSYTTACDGYRVWSAMREETRKKFREKQIVYDREVPEDKWKNYVMHCDRRFSSVEGINLEDLVKLKSDVGSADLKLLNDGSLHYRFAVGAARKTLFNEGLAFANSILGPSYNYKAPQITFEDGEPLSREVMEEVKFVTDKFTVDIEWESGDIVLIDNTRVMHGRRKIEDENRLIYNALSYL